MTISEARAELPSVLDRVSAGEEITITRHGKPVAVVVAPDALRRRGRADLAFARAEQIRIELEAAKLRPLSPPTMSAERAEQLVQEIYADRRAR